MEHLCRKNNWTSASEASVVFYSAHIEAVFSPASSQFESQQLRLLTKSEQSLENKEWDRDPSKPTHQQSGSADLLLVPGEAPSFNW